MTTLPARILLTGFALFILGVLRSMLGWLFGPDIYEILLFGIPVAICIYEIWGDLFFRQSPEEDDPDDPDDLVIKKVPQQPVKLLVIPMPPEASLEPLNFEGEPITDLRILEDSPSKLRH